MRLPTGGTWIDRSRPIRFTFDGRELEGFAGDTLASALLANDVDVVCRSPILGRPRGVMTAGADEPCAFVAVDAPTVDPVVAATAVLLEDGLEARGVPGVGRLPPEAIASPADHRHRHVDTLVVGSGHDGLVAAGEAAALGERVLLVEREPVLAGAGTDRAPDDVEIMTRATALGLYDDAYAVVHERRGFEGDRLWHIRGRRVVLATGGHERMIAFSGNDRPGVMLSSAVHRYAFDFGVLAGRRAVVFSCTVQGAEIATQLRELGVEVAALVDVRDAAVTDMPEGVELFAGWAITGTEGTTRVGAARLAGPDGSSRTEACDLIVVVGGWNPALQLWRAIGGGLRFDAASSAFVPDGNGPPWLSVVGSAEEPHRHSPPYWYVPADDYTEHFVDFQRDQTVGDVLAAVDTGLRSVEHVKRATYIGTAIDQGRTSGVITAEIVNSALGDPAAAQGPTNARPPYTPVAFATLAGAERGDLLDPIRTTPIHASHVEHGAVFEDVGQWKRPRYFPRPGEDMEAAVLRECAAVRTEAGLLDASTLGKIDVVGPDAATFLDRMYTNRVSTLAVGHIRYGLMVGLDGMVADDGTVMRLADDHFFVTTTTGNAAMVLDRFDEWLQTEWPELRVWCTSATEQWVTAAVGGPRARAILEAAGTDIDVSPEAFPFMTFREGSVAGVPAHVARISFTGELSFEVNVDGRSGLHLWERLLEVGEPVGLTPYGTEAMHVLRAEKGYPIVGQDTDGTVTPDDLGLSWMVRKDDSDFVGRRSLSRIDSVRADRKQLVGLLPVDGETVIAEGAQLVDEDADLEAIPVPMRGHVTSSYRSTALGRPFALAMLERGRERIGDRVLASFGGRTALCEVVPPVFVDPEGARRDG